MNNAAASLAPGTPSGIGEVAITGEQQLVECGVGQQVSVQVMRPSRLEGRPASKAAAMTDAVVARLENVGTDMARLSRSMM